MKKTNKILISVYGSLRQGLGNHAYHLGKAEYLGTFSTEPNFTLHSLGSYPGLKNDGYTSVVMEVYRVTDEEARLIDNLEGYNPNKESTFYDKQDLMTPWGLSSVYIYVNELQKSSIVSSGDWKKFKDSALSYNSLSNN